MRFAEVAGDGYLTPEQMFILYWRVSRIRVVINFVGPSVNGSIDTSSAINGTERKRIQSGDFMQALDSSTNGSGTITGGAGVFLNDGNPISLEGSKYYSEKRTFLPEMSYGCDDDDAFGVSGPEPQGAYVNPTAFTVTFMGVQLPCFENGGSISGGMEIFPVEYFEYRDSNGLNPIWDINNGNLLLRNVPPGL